ncbi:hypothetical protein SGPA1_40570 [Streptomyces misionensis JCM 4497]
MRSHGLPLDEDPKRSLYAHCRIDRFQSIRSLRCSDVQRGSTQFPCFFTLAALSVKISGPGATFPP